jgi:hypothetical protein
VPAGRAPDGRFARGNRLSRGNPFSRRQCQLRRALAECLTVAAARAYGKKLLSLAMEGDSAAGKLLLGYALGKPTATPDPDRQDLHEWALLSAAPTAAEATAVALDALPLREVLAFCKAFIHLSEVAQQTVLADGEDEADRLESVRRRRLHHGPPR